jgi:hypothetical protein
MTIVSSLALGGQSLRAPLSRQTLDSRFAGWTLKANSAGPALQAVSTRRTSLAYAHNYFY